jgi:hypothetical protein
MNLSNERTARPSAADVLVSALPITASIRLTLMKLTILSAVFVSLLSISYTQSAQNQTEPPTLDQDAVHHGAFLFREARQSLRIRL